MESSEAADAISGVDSHIKSFFKHVLPKSKTQIRSCSNTELAQKLVDLYEPCKLLLEHLLDQEQELANLRSKSLKRNYLIVFIEEFVTKMKNVETTTLQDLQDANDGYKSPSLTIIQRERE